MSKHCKNQRYLPLSFTVGSPQRILLVLSKQFTTQSSTALVTINLPLGLSLPRALVRFINCVCVNVIKERYVHEDRRRAI